MKVEPCPFCGSEVNVDTLERISCPNCCYRGGVLLESNECHNRLSRIVRAAETYVRVRHQYVKDVLAGGEFEVENVDGAMAVSIADRALVDAVEGGRAE